MYLRVYNQYTCMEVYNKPPLTYAQQIDLLRSRGLIIPDESRTERHLSNIGYYRLSAYMYPYKQVKGGIIQDNFIPDTTWDMVYDLYVFDRKLRLLVFDAIERLEVAIRTQIIYQLSHKYGSHWHDNCEIFKPLKKTYFDRRTGKKKEKEIDVYKDIQDHIQIQLHSNKAEVFIRHYRNKYNSPENPPSWMSVEVMYFNHLSLICEALKKRSDRKEIADYFSLPPEIFLSWLHTINYVRNVCAHHARLWNRGLNITPEVLKFSKKNVWISNPDTVMRSKLYYFLCMLNYLLQTVNPTSTFKKRLKALLDEYHEVIPLDAMGFPKEWASERLWEV